MSWVEERFSTDQTGHIKGGGGGVKLLRFAGGLVPVQRLIAVCKRSHSIVESAVTTASTEW
jgi:hypothetical protein